MKKTVITKCGEELLGPQASLRVTPYQPVPNHTKGAFWFCCLLYFFPDYHHVMSFFFFVFPSFMSSYTLFWTTVIFFGYGFGTCQLPFFLFFFSFFLFEFSIISFSLFMLLLPLIIFCFQIFTSEITWQCFLRLFNISPISN